MFVDTPKDATIREFLTDELIVAMNTVRSDLNQIRRGPHARSAKQVLPSHVTAMRTVYAMWCKVGGYEVTPGMDEEYHATYGAAAAH